MGLCGLILKAKALLMLTLGNVVSFFVYKALKGLIEPLRGLIMPSRALKALKRALEGLQGPYKGPKGLKRPSRPLYGP